MYLVRFQQGLSLASAHWALYLPHSDATIDSYGIPSLGTLFHARKDAINCSNLNGNAMFEPQKNFKLQESGTFLDHCVLGGTDVQDYILSSACDHISHNRGFHLIFQNCQDWVHEVLSYLVEQGSIPNTVFEEMKRGKFIPLSNNGCVKCIRSSLSLNCKCKKRTA